MPTFIHRQVEAARSGQLPTVVHKLSSGWVVLGEKQVVKAYCLLLPDPVVPHLNALRGAARAQFLTDMALVGDAILKVTGAVRINYEMLGNLEPALHAHVVPRYRDEPPGLITKPFWFYDWDQAPVFDAKRDGDLIQRIAQELQR